MILPIVAYGSPVLRTVCEDIGADYPNLDKLIADMWETMYNSNGVGLAAPQVNVPIRLFVIDSEQIFANKEEDEELNYPDAPGYKGVFLNAHITRLNGTEWAYNEGCLSIPDIRGMVMRPKAISVRGLNRQGKKIELTASGLPARVIQHETDHLDGVLFFDRMKTFETLTYLDEYSRFWRKHDDDGDE